MGAMGMGAKGDKGHRRRMKLRVGREVKGQRRGQWRMMLRLNSRKAGMEVRRRDRIMLIQVYLRLLSRELVYEGFRLRLRIRGRIISTRVCLRRLQQREKRKRCRRKSITYSPPNNLYPEIRSMVYQQDHSRFTSSRGAGYRYEIYRQVLVFLV
jgi:hypothetical protein